MFVSPSVHLFVNTFPSKASGLNAQKLYVCVGRTAPKTWVLTKFPFRCTVYTFLEAWRFDEDLILSASQQEILDAVNLLVRRLLTVTYSYLHISIQSGVSESESEVQVVEKL